MKVLLVEDEIDLGVALQRTLQQEQYIVDWVQDGAAAWDYLDSQQTQYTLAVFDWMLPGLTGLELCKRLREQQNSLPVLMLTARDRWEDKVMGLDAGADDYLVKPFRMEELLARLRALWRRSPQFQPTQIQVGSFTLDCHNRTICWQSPQKEGRRTVRLSKKEFQLMEYFMKHPRHAATRDQILTYLYELDTERISNVVAAQVRLLRRRLTELGCEDAIQTVPGEDIGLIPPMQTRLFRQTRLQLAGWYAVVMGLILSLGALTIYQVIIRAYSDSIDRELEAVTETLHNGIELNLTQPGQLEPIIQKLVPDVCVVGKPCLNKTFSTRNHNSSNQHHSLNTIRQSDYYVRFLDNSGTLVATAGLRPDVPLTKGSETWQTVVDAEGNRFHQMSLPLHTLDNQLWGYLQVGRSLKDLDDRLASLKLAFLIGLPVITTLVAVSSWFLAEIAMRPIYRSYQQMQRFTTDAAHELRTPLAAILATVDSVSRLPSLTELETRDTLKTIERQLNRFFELIKDLFLLARLEQHTLAIQRESVCLNDLIHDLVEEFSALADANGLTLMAEIQVTKELHILADEDQVYRLISNLVVNSIQYTPTGGAVTLVLNRDEGHAVIQVQDTGMGIAPVEQAHIFDRFYRVNRDRSRQTGGSGLGLAIAKAIAEAHEGSLQVQSEVGRGSTFTVRLPLKSRPITHHATVI